ncbi:hypothetical protein P2318_03740 [Myxococcaceae bacterium GXIMD 01537]
MNIKEAIAWFDEIAQRKIGQNARAGVRNALTGGAVYEYEHGEAVRWIAEAESALKAVFPPSHSLVRRWDVILESTKGQPHLLSVDSVVHSARGLFDTAHSQLKAGRVAGLVDAIRAETIGELLEQAEALTSRNYLAAATVIAGGALESFLQHLCVRNGLSWAGDGSITRYEGALAQARNAGKEVVSATDGKLITGWGGMRNDAAHNPGAFSRRADEVRLMIEGIRQFVARFPS